MNEFKICILGDGGVGKSAMTIRFCMDKFVEYYDPTIMDNYRKQMILEDESYNVDILDTAGQEEYSPLKDTFIKSSDGFVIVYSITDMKSFERIETLHQSIVEERNSDTIPCFVVGNKTDLEDQREVPYEMGYNMALSFSNCLFKEISAKVGEGITDIFENILRSITRYYQQNPNKKKEKKGFCKIL
eukprot:TRINITY_DN4170_c0_g1_i1.p1 TRINITY_DN4170_c0_g1~~TRINITY_DN4170_c0_g1_i1.p1  ORF type:complete len:187 (+),score=53.46 TRINITY_DN4170_c0_g1_i1:76-636(+)